MPPSWRNRVKELRYLRPSELADHPLQWRTHPDTQRRALAGVLEDVGIAGAGLAYVSEATGQLTSIDGHLRKSMGDVPWPTLILDVTDAESRLLLASHDPLAGLAEANALQLDALLQQTATHNQDVQALLDQIATTYLPPDVGLTSGEGQDAEPQIDRAEVLREQWGVEVGQLWQAGEHRVICGDCTEKVVLKRLFNGAIPDIVINDPPYGMRLDTDFSSMTSKPQFARNKKAFGGHQYPQVLGDASDFNAAPLAELLTHIDEQFWFGADYYAASLGDTAHAGAWLVWDKRLDEVMDRMYGSCFELIWSRKKHKRLILRHKWAGIFGMEHESHEERSHPTQKPAVLIQDILTRYSAEGAVVADCFLGSGTTMIACQNLGRLCYGVEISPAYVAVCLQRFVDATGMTPVMLEG
jgi:DNA modification methylase